MLDRLEVLINATLFVAIYCVACVVAGAGFCFGWALAMRMIR